MYVQESADKSKQRIDSLISENKSVEKQRSELHTAFKKQMKLIDVLKRQKVCVGINIDKFKLSLFKHSCTWKRQNFSSLRRKNLSKLWTGLTKKFCDSTILLLPIDIVFSVHTYAFIVKGKYTNISTNVRAQKISKFHDVVHQVAAVK